MKPLLIILLTCVVSTFAIAQPLVPQSNLSSSSTGNKSGKIQALKIAYITQKVDLSPAQAEKFWPVYNNYMKEIKQVRKDNIWTSDELEVEQKVLNIRKKYRTEFSKILPEEKVNDLFKAEKEFNTIAQKEIMERQEARKNAPAQ